MVAPYPKVIREKDIDQEAESAFSLVEKVIYTIRNIRGEMKLSPGTATDIYLIGEADDPDRQIIEANTSMIFALVRSSHIIVQTTEPTLDFACMGMYGKIKIILPLPGELLQQELVC